MENWLVNDLLTEENYKHILWLGELPEMEWPQLLAMREELIGAVSEELVPETAIFYNVSQMFLVPDGDEVTRKALETHKLTHNTYAITSMPVVESTAVNSPRCYVPGQVNLTCFLHEEGLQGGPNIIAERLEDILIGSLLNYDIYGEHAQNIDGGGAGVLTRKGKRLITLHISGTKAGVYVVDVMINVSNDVSALEALLGEEEFSSMSEESFSMIDADNLKQELGNDLAISLGKRPQRLDLFGLGNALMRAEGGVKQKN